MTHSRSARSPAVTLRNTVRRPVSFRVEGKTVRLSPGEMLKNVPEAWLHSAELQHLRGSGLVAVIEPTRSRGARSGAARAAPPAAPPAATAATTAAATSPAAAAPSAPAPEVPEALDERGPAEPSVPDVSSETDRDVADRARPDATTQPDAPET